MGTGIVTILDRMRAQVLLPSGEPRPGAVSRIAEHLGVSHTTVYNWLSGTWAPGKAALARIENMLKSGVYLGAKKRGPKPGRKNSSCQLSKTQR